MYGFLTEARGCQIPWTVVTDGCGLLDMGAGN